MIEYRPGWGDLRQAVGVALAQGATRKGVEAGFYYLNAAGEFVASDDLVDSVLDVFSGVIRTSLKMGGVVRLEGLGTFYVERSLAHIATGAVTGPIPTQKVPKMRISAKLVVGMPVTQGEPGGEAGG